MLALVPKWNEVCCDDGWIAALLAWYHSQHMDDDCIQLETNFYKRPLIQEPLQLMPHDNNSAAALMDKEGKVYAKFTSQARAQRPNPLTFSEEMDFDFRLTDSHARRAMPFTFYFQAMHECLPMERALIHRLEIQRFDRNLTEIPIGSTFKLQCQRESDALFRLQVSFNNLVLSQALLELDTRAGHTHRENRYDITRRLEMSPRFSDYADITRDLKNIPVCASLKVLPHEFDPVCIGFSYMAQANLALLEILEHAFPRSSPYAMAVQDNGQTKYTVFWRSAALQVFDHSLPLMATTPPYQRELVSTSWIERTGASAFDVRVDLSHAQDKSSVVAAMQCTVLLIDIATKRGAPLFYEKSWAEDRYEFGKHSPVPASSFQPKLSHKSGNWSSPAFSYALDIRHSDQDLNGHMNSGRYLVLTEDAKHAATQAGYFPQHFQRATNSKNHALRSKTWIDYIGEVHRNSTCSIQVRYQSVELDNNKNYAHYILYEYVMDGIVRNRVTVEYYNHYETMHNKL